MESWSIWLFYVWIEFKIELSDTRDVFVWLAQSTATARSMSIGLLWFQFYWLSLQLVHSHGVLEHLTLSHVTWALDCALCYSWRVCLISWEHCDCAVNVDRSAQFPAHCALWLGLTFLPSLTIPYLPSLTPILQPIFFCFCFACVHWNGQIKIANVCTF